MNSNITDEREQVLHSGGNMSGNGLLIYLTTIVISTVKSRSSMAIKLMCAFM